MKTSCNSNLITLVSLDNSSKEMQLTTHCSSPHINLQSFLTVLQVAIEIPNVKRVKMRRDSQYPTKRDHMICKCLSLSITYAATIGGLITITGTSTNLIFAEQFNTWVQVVAKATRKTFLPTLRPPPPTQNRVGTCRRCLITVGLVYWQPFQAYSVSGEEGRVQTK